MTGKAGFNDLTTPLKGVLLVLSILAIIVPPTAGFILFDTRIKSNTSELAKASEKIDRLDDEVDELRLSNAVIETKFNQIMKEIQSLNNKIDDWEPVKD